MAKINEHYRKLVAGYLGLANGLGFLAGAAVGHFLLRSRLDPPDGHLLDRLEERSASQQKLSKPDLEDYVHCRFGGCSRAHLAAIKITHYQVRLKLPK
jgi:hypothetical protein